MDARLVLWLASILLVLMILTPIVGPVIDIVKAQAVGYLAIKDYLGTTWTIEDVQKIINTTINTPEGPKSLADYFWIVIDNDTNNPINLRDFIVSPLDNTTAVLSLSPGDHTIDIYWFGYHQRQLVNIVENTTYTLNLETAPVMPFQTAGEPSTDYEWDLASNPDGLTIQRRDGKAWVRFNYNATFITVAVYDDDTGWNYYTLDIDINNGYDWRFHITDPANPEYTEEHTGSFLWFTWDIAKVAEKTKWNRTGEILHLVYTVVVAENQALFNAVDEFWSAASRSIVEIAGMKQYIDPITNTIHRLEDFITFVQSAYNTYIGEFFAGKYQKTIVLVWDVFATPTQIVILAHAYDVDSTGTLTPRSIISSNAFILNNRLVFAKQLHGGAEYYLVDNSYYEITFQATGSLTQTISQYYKVDIGGITGYNTNNPRIRYPGGDYFKFHVDDLSKYIYEFWFTWSDKYTREDDEWCKAQYNIELWITFNESSKADLFEQRLSSNGIYYVRTGNTFKFNKSTGEYTVSLNSYTSRSVYSNFGWSDEGAVSIYDLIPENSSGYVRFAVTGYVKAGKGPVLSGNYDQIKYHVDKVLVRFVVIPKMTPPQISLLKDGYQVVNNAFAVQVYTDLYREDQDAYLLGYYILGNEPPPSFIIRDVYYDIENDIVHYVYTIISTDCYGQDIVEMTANHTLNANNETIYQYNLNIKPTIRLFNDVTLALFSFSRMAFLNLAPEVIEYLLVIPPNQGGYGTPILDWATVSSITLNFSRPYELYYYDKPSDSWVRVKTVYYNDTKVYDIVRYADNVLVEKLNVSEMSQYYYKLVYTDTNETYKGWLFNDNGTLMLITGEVKWSLSPEELQALLASVQLQGIIDQWNQFWNDIARKLGLISESLAATANWFNANWIWLLLGFFGVLFMIVLIFAVASRPRVTITVPRTR